MGSAARPPSESPAAPYSRRTSETFIAAEFYFVYFVRSTRGGSPRSPQSAPGGNRRQRPVARIDQITFRNGSGKRPDYSLQVPDLICLTPFYRLYFPSRERDRWPSR